MKYGKCRLTGKPFRFSSSNYPMGSRDKKMKSIRENRKRCLKLFESVTGGANICDFALVVLK